MATVDRSSEAFFPARGAPGHPFEYELSLPAVALVVGRCDVTARKRTVTAALERSLKALDTPPVDETGIELARRYAQDIDEAAVLSVAADKLIRDCRLWLEPATYDRLVAQMTRIEKTAVLALLGPKLVQVLAELGMTPRARADVTGKGGRANEPPRNELATWRAERRKGLNSS